MSITIMNVKKILLIEDEDIIVELLSKKLSQENYELYLAKNGREGLEKMNVVKPDLVLLDIIMPEMDGFEFLEKISQNTELKNIPVIIISNSGQPVELNRAKNLGAKDWLIKTKFNPQEVIDKVKNQIG